MLNWTSVAYIAMVAAWVANSPTSVILRVWVSALGSALMRKVMVVAR
jgi:hypothetical protein